MRAEQHIPLFLWVTAAIVMHAVGGGGATEVARRIEETLDIRDFAADVRRHASALNAPLEVSLLEETEPSEENSPSPPPDTAQEDQADQSTDEDIEDATPDSEMSPEKTEPKETERKETERKELDPPVTPEEKKKEKEEAPEQAQPEPETPKDPVPELQMAQKPPPPMQPNRRVAVEQHVEDPNQEDNPDAEFIGEHANHVEEQTRASITSTDSNADAATMGGPSKGSGAEPGNSDQTQVAQSDESPGATDRPAGEAGQSEQDESRAARPAQATAAAGANSPQESQAAIAARQGQTAREAIAKSEAQEASPETLHAPNGSFSVARAQQARQAQMAQRTREAIAGIERRKANPLLGLGSVGLTPNGVNLNLSHNSAQSIVGADEIARVRQKDGERRLSEHRGGWTTMGLERWKPALENYVATVKPGNQTALNTAHSPFARYLNQIHQRLHQVFAYRFLSHLDKLPADHPLNNMTINTHLEIALNPQDGGIVKMGVTKSSGVTAFDVGALDSVEKAAPFGPPPASIISYDGNVYLHWEFHREPIYACSTYNAHPYILDAEQKSAPPRVQPPKKPTYDEKTAPAKPDERSGVLQREPHDHSHHPG